MSVNPTYFGNGVPRPWLTYSDCDRKQQRKLEKVFKDEAINFYGFFFRGEPYLFSWFFKPYSDGYCYPCDESGALLRIQLNDREETLTVERRETC